MLWVARYYPTGTQEEPNSNFELLSSSNIYYKDFNEKKKINAQQTKVSWPTWFFRKDAY